MTELNRNIPLISIQCDWYTSLRQKGGTAWISYKYYGKNSCQCTITKESSAKYEVIPKDFLVENISLATIRVKHLESGYTCGFKATDYEYTNIHKKSVQSLEVTSDGLAVSSCSDGKLCIWDTRAAIVKTYLTGHMGDVYKCKFFPSGVVVLSCGADMLLKIWCANTARCPVTLKGHTAAVTDVCIVDRGMNVISVSKDGTAKLWSCGKACCIADLIKVKSQINCCTLSINETGLDLFEEKPVLAEHEVGTNNKILIIGCEDGRGYAIVVSSRKKLSSVNCSSAVNAVAADSKTFVVGCQDGSLKLFDIFSSNIIKCFAESSSAILCVLLYKEVGVFCGKADGTCILYATCENNSEIHDLQLTGSHYDHIFDISADETGIYTACRDGIIRKYVMPQNIKQLIKIPVNSEN